MVRTFVAAFAAMFSLSVAAPALAQEAVAGESDHSKVVGKFGVGYYGNFTVPVGATGTDVNLPTIGVRYWLSDQLGIDGAIGLSVQSGESKVGGTSTDQSFPFGFALRAAMPYKLLANSHYTFFAAPEIGLGFTSQSIDATNTDLSGFRFAFGGRAGAEIHFGFIGLPNLALDATVSLLADVATGSTDPSGGTESSFSRFTLTTGSGNQPWNIFTVSNLVARYYF